LATKLGLAGQEQVKSKFQQEHIWEALHREYLGLLQVKEPPLFLTPYARKSSRLAARSNE
jgi:hypothetical protein